MEREPNPSFEGRHVNGEVPSRRRVDIIVVTKEKEFYIIRDVEVVSQAGQHA